MTNLSIGEPTYVFMLNLGILPQIAHKPLVV